MVRPHLRVAALVFAALGFGACDGGSDDRESAGAGITLLPASDDTRAALGVVSWDVRPLDANRLSITGLDGGQTDVVGFMITTTPESVTIQAHGLSSGQLVIAADGTIIDDSLSDADALERFQIDGEAKLAAAGYRISMQCAADLTAAQGICGMALMSGNPIQVLQCGVAMSKAAMSCFGGGMGGGGMTGGGMTGGGMTGGGMTGGSGGMTGGSGGGYGESGGGYGSGGSGGYGSGGYGSGGYGSGGYGSGGYGEGGYGEGGYGEGGYGEGGYGEGGYGEGGGYYSQVDRPGRTRMRSGGIPAGAQIVDLAFAPGESGVRSADLSRWNLEGSR